MSSMSGVDRCWMRFIIACLLLFLHHLTNRISIHTDDTRAIVSLLSFRSFHSLFIISSPLNNNCFLSGRPTRNQRKHRKSARHWRQSHNNNIFHSMNELSSFHRIVYKLQTAKCCCCCDLDPRILHSAVLQSRRLSSIIKKAKNRSSLLPFSLLLWIKIMRSDRNK